VEWGWIKVIENRKYIELIAEEAPDWLKSLYINEISYAVKAKLLGIELFDLLREELTGQYDVIYQS
jgi:hypothetical protein